MDLNIVKVSNLESISAISDHRNSYPQKSTLIYLAHVFSQVIASGNGKTYQNAQTNVAMGL